MVSHDRYLLDRLTEQLFIFDGNGKITIYNGNYADYKEEQATIAENNKKKTEAKPSEPLTPATETKKKLTFREREEYKSLDEEIPELEREISKQTLALANTTDHVQLSDIATEIERLNQLLDAKTERWLELGELI